jgi:hypothetical protein
MEEDNLSLMISSPSSVPKLPKIQRSHLTREGIACSCHLQMAAAGNIFYFPNCLLLAHLEEEVEDGDDFLEMEGKSSGI